MCPDIEQIMYFPIATSNMCFAGGVKNEGFDVNRIAFRAHGTDAISGSVPVWGEGGSVD